MEYKISEEQLAALVKNVYEEACCGYMDLKDSVCAKTIKEFLSDKKTVETPQPSASINWHTSTGYVGNITGSATGSNATPTFVPPPNEVVSSGNYFISNEGNNNFVIHDSSIRREANLVRPEEYVRPEVLITATISN